MTVKAIGEFCEGRRAGVHAGARAGRGWSGQGGGRTMAGTFCRTALPAGEEQVPPAAPTPDEATRSRPDTDSAQGQRQ